ncbi:MAG: hypothetical protein IKH76_04215 [Clostridiales bacterium]|nr:hypothetical protein [Clostridiales bacterium]
MRSTKIVSILLAALFVFSFAGCSSKKKCASCGKTEDEVELFLLDPKVYPNSKDAGKYYCSVCYRIAVSRIEVPEIADAISDQEKSQSDEAALKEMVAKFFDAFDKGDYEQMKPDCSLNCISNCFRDGGVFGMKRAKVTEYGPGEFYETNQGVHMYKIKVTVDMEPLEGSSLAGQNSTSFYVVLLQNVGGKWTIHDLKTEV